MFKIELLKTPNANFYFVDSEHETFKLVVVDDAICRYQYFGVLVIFLVS